MSTPTGMNESMKQGLRAHLVRTANEEPARQRTARRNAALTGAAGLGLALGGLTIGWGLGVNNANPPAAEQSTVAPTDQPTDHLMGGSGGPYTVWYQFVGSAHVTLPPYPVPIIAEATFTCEEAGSLAVGDDEARTCAAGESFTVTVKLDGQSTQLPVVAQDGQAWTFRLVYGGEDDGAPEPTSSGDVPQIVPGGAGGSSS
ncbi:hypothetical protein [Pseudactinotalea terrae]|uniref:hypothetical protein n=1 Tax=Pseudactinotalea terrae TaxID=1743262 RepID=UPI0012E2A513|nr:hypothetical protein [Pseudactinotalea terrae]